MPSNPDSKFQFRDRELAKKYDQDFSREKRDISAKVRLKRWETLVPILLEEVALELKEAQILYSLLKECNIYAEASLENLQINLEILRKSIMDSIYDYQSNIDTFSNKIESISSAHWYAILDAFDRIDYQNENIEIELKRVGLVEQNK